MEPMELTAAQIARHFEAGNAPASGYYVEVPNGYFHIVGGQFRRTASGRRSATVELQYFATGRTSGTAVYDGKTRLTVV
jgi:hypothetical protein